MSMTPRRMNSRAPCLVAQIMIWLFSLDDHFFLSARWDPSNTVMLGSYVVIGASMQSKVVACDRL